MLCLSRKDGQWIEIRHRTGDLLRVRVYQVQCGVPGRVSLAFDDDARHFAIERPERARRPAHGPRGDRRRAAGAGSSVRYPRLDFQCVGDGESPAVRGTSLTVDEVLARVLEGWSHAEILRMYPELTIADVMACLAYVADQDRHAVESS